MITRQSCCLGVCGPFAAMELCDCEMAVYGEARGSVDNVECLFVVDKK